MTYMHIYVDIVAIGRKKILLFVEVFVNLGSILLNKTTQKQKDKYFMFSIVWDLKMSPIVEWRLVDYLRFHKRLHRK